MSGLRLLKLCAWVIILNGAAHLAGHYQALKAFESPAPGLEQQAVQAMHGYVVGEGPGSRSLAKLYIGFSLFFSFASVLIGALVLAAARELAANAAALKRIAILLVLALAGLTAVSAVYFFAPPTVLLTVALMAAAGAAIRLRQSA